MFHAATHSLRHTREGQRGEGRTKALLLEFARTCGLPHASAPLPSNEAALLQELQKEAKQER